MSTCFRRRRQGDQSVQAELGGTCLRRVSPSRRTTLPYYMSISIPTLALANPTVESVATHLESHPAAWIILVAALGPIIAIALAVFAVVKWFIPLYKEESAASRQHLAEVLTATRKDASEDLKAARETSRDQQAAIVDRIGNRVDETHRQVGDIHSIVKALAMRAGTVAVVLWLLLGLGTGASAGVVWRVLRGHPNNVPSLARPTTKPSPPTTQHDCSEIGGCEAPQYCCAHNGCCRNAHGEDSYASVPHSLRLGQRDYGDAVFPARRWEG